jgi:hypothetical protein
MPGWYLSLATSSFQILSSSSIAILLEVVRMGAEKSSIFPIFLLATQPKEFFLDGLKNLEQRSHKWVELRGEYVE